MLSAIEHLMRFHPASHFGRFERRQFDFETFEELEHRHSPPRREYEIERGEPTWMIGEVAATAAMLLVFCGIVTAVARLTADSSDTAQQPAIEISEASEPR